MLIDWWCCSNGLTRSFNCQRFICSSSRSSFAFRAFKQTKEPPLLKASLPKATTIFTRLLQIPSPGVRRPPSESSLCASCQSRRQSNLVAGEQKLLSYSVISLRKHGLRTSASRRNDTAQRLLSASGLPAGSVPGPPRLQKICERKIKLTAQRVNSSAVAKPGDKEGNGELMSRFLSTWSQTEACDSHVDDVLAQLSLRLS